MKYFKNFNYNLFINKLKAIKGIIKIFLFIFLFYLKTIGFRYSIKQLIAVFINPNFLYFVKFMFIYLINNKKYQLI